MIVKINNTQIIEDVKQIDFKNIKLANQIILFNNGEEDSYNYEEVGVTVDKITTMVLSNIYSKCMFGFDCMDNMPSIDIGENTIERIDENGEKIEEYEYSVDSVYNDIIEKNYMHNFLVIGNNAIDLKNISIEKLNNIDLEAKNTFAGYYDKELKEIDSDYNNHVLYRNSIFKNIYNNIFESTYRKEYEFYDKMSNTRENIFYFSLPIENDNVLILMINHNINIKTRQWEIKPHIYIMNKNCDLFEILDSFESFIRKLEKIEYDKFNNYSHSSYKDFKKDYEISKYDVRNYLEDPIKIAELKAIFNYGFDAKYDIEYNFFKPIYQCKDLKFKAYNASAYYASYNSYYNGKQGIIYTIDDKEVRALDIEKMENSDLLMEHIKIAQSIGNFYQNGYQGFNPEDGYWYSGPERVSEDMEKRVIYRDYEGIIYKARYNNQDLYYVKEHGYFISTENCVADYIEQIEELKERKKLLEVLKEAQ